MQGNRRTSNLGIYVYAAGAIFGLMFWAPKIFVGPSHHFVWAGNAICIAIAGAAGVVSDAICHTGR